jgi:membrane fusion protein (multidrug efflux system)
VITRKTKIIIGPITILIGGFMIYLFGNRFISTDNAYLKAHIVPISAEISGKVSEVLVENNARVEADQLLFRLEPTAFQLAVTQAQENLRTVKTELESLKAEYLKTQATVEKVTEQLAYATKEYTRSRHLAETQVISHSQFDKLLNDYQAATQDLAIAKQALASIQAKLGGIAHPSEEHPRYQQALAALNLAQLNLNHSEIKAPVSGIIANLSLQPGHYVTTSVPQCSLIHDERLWIEANFKETDVTYIYPGQAATIEIDTYPGQHWQAHVMSISPATGSEFSILPAQNSSGNWVKVVQRIMVKLAFDPTEKKPRLSAGMSAGVTIDTGHSRLGRFFVSDPP